MVMPLIGDVSCIAMQIACGSLLKNCVHTAMAAKVGAAARLSQTPRPEAACSPPAGAPIKASLV